MIYPGFDPDTFSGDGNEIAGLDTERTSLGYNSDDFIILFATSGAYAKRGVGTFLDALAAFVGAVGADKLRARPVLALMIGKADEHTLMEQVRARGLEGSVRYLSTVERIERYYRAADVLVHSAVVEEFGQVIQESAVSGCPVIVLHWAATTEIFGRELGEYVLDEPSADLIAAGLSRTYRAERADIRARWKERLSDEMKGNTWQRNSELSHALCAEVLAEKRSGARPRPQPAGN